MTEGESTGPDATPADSDGAGTSDPDRTARDPDGDSAGSAGGDNAGSAGGDRIDTGGIRTDGGEPAAASEATDDHAPATDPGETTAADELKRRLVHASGSGLVALWLLAQRLDLPLTWDRFELLMIALAAGVIGLEVVRLRVGLDWWVYETLTRSYERDQFAGYGYYIVSMAVVVVIFRPDVALPAMLMVAIGDPISGALSDDVLRRIKRLPVLVATFGVMLVLALPFLHETPAAAVAAALGATVADGVKVTRGEFVLDDNLTIPIYAATAAWAVLEFGAV